MSKPPKRSSSSHPNVIARLMGMDAIPVPKPAPAAAAAIIVQPQPTTRIKPATTTIAAAAETAPLRQAKCSLLSYRTRNKKMRVPGRWHHPQEDLLQKIKQDFQAWQASRALMDTCSATTQPLDGRRIQMIAQANLRKQKMARYGFVADDSKVVARETTTAADHDKVAVADGELPLEPRQETTVITVLRASPCAAASEKFRDFEAASKDGHDCSSASDEEMLRSTAVPVVLLKPTSSDDTLLDVAHGQTPLLFGLPKLRRDANMSRFLEEVKEMLHKEMQQVNATNKVVTWGSEPKQQIARDVAKDPLSKRVFSRSESFRGFRSDRKRNDATLTKQASPEHAVRILTTRSILAPSRLKTVASSRAETVASPRYNKDDEESMSSSCSITSTRERVVRSLADASPSGVGFGDQSFRSECLMMRHRDDTSTVSPARALLRSFSAPESGFFSIGRLFGDGSVRSTTPHEASSEGASVLTSKGSAPSFSFIRGTVSSLTRHLKFRRKQTHWSKKTSLGVGEIHPQVAIATPPPSPETTFNLFKVAQANLTELPPSPVSPLEVVSRSCRHFFSDFNCSFPELSPKCHSEFEAPASELSSYRTDMTVETACSHDKAYIREVLVAAGLYDDDDNKDNGRVDSICDDIFEEVEDIYYYRGNYCDHVNNDTTGRNAADHRLLFDLANEALQSLVMQGAKVGSSMRQWVIDSTGVSRGRRLVDDVWQQVQTLRNPEMQEMQTIDSMVAYEIRKSVWAEVLYEDVYVVGRKIERAVFDELIQDLLIEVFV